MGFLVASAAMCSEPRKDEDGDAGAGGEGLDSSGGGATGGRSERGGSGGSVTPPPGGEGGDGPGSGGTAGESGQSNGGSAGDGGSSGGAGSDSGGTSGSASGGIGGGAGSTAGAMSGGTGGSNGGRGGSGGGGGSGAGLGGTGGGGASGTVLFSDDFETGTDGWTPTPSGLWATLTDGSTVYGVTGAPPNSSARTASAGDVSWTNVELNARVKITSFAGISSSYFAGICVRYQSNSLHACLALRSSGTVAFRVSGTNTAAYTPPSGSITTGVWYTLRVVAIGDNITGYVNGAEVGPGTRVVSGAPASGMIALSAPATNAVFDDVRVTVP